MRPLARTSFLWISWAAIVGFGVAGCSTSDTTSPDGGTQTGGTGGSSTEPILDGGGEAATPPDGKSLCPPGPCNYQTGEGCAANTTCAPSGGEDGGTPICEPAGSAAVGAACQAWTDCVPGAVCADNVCRKLCCGRDWTGCPANEHCFHRFVVQLTPTKTVDSLAYLCFPANTCSALDPASCAAIKPGTTCQIADPTGATACLDEGTGAAGQPCPCKGGFTCVSDRCRRLCKAVPGGGEPSCPEGEGTCTHFVKDPDGVGECTPLGNDAGR